jgi:hypothetical protein
VTLPMGVQPRQSAVYTVLTRETADSLRSRLFLLCLAFRLCVDPQLKFNCILCR